MAEKVTQISEAVTAKAAAVVESDWLDFDDLIAKDDQEYVTAEIPNWGKMCFGSLSAAEMMNWAEGNKGEAKKTGGIRLIIVSMVDKNKRHVPAERVDELVEKFRSKNAKAVDEAIDVIMKLNGLKISEEAIKNALSEARSESSPTVLR